MSVLLELQEHERALYAALGRMIVEWNLTEDRMRDLLNSFLDPISRNQHLASRIITIEMGPVGITQALHAIADALETSSKDAIEWIAEYQDRLREYRNYYVHGLTGALPSTDSDSGVLGFIRMMRAKGELAQDKDYLTVPQINDVALRSIILRTYINQVLNHLMWRPDDPRNPPFLSERP